MARSQISFFTEDTEFVLKEKALVRDWIKRTIGTEKYKTGTLNFIFCSDAYLLEINQQYLQHDTYTDIVTFDSSEDEDYIEGDIFISVDRTKENATKFGVTERDELHRVIIHGVLHLLGYTDKGTEKKEQMTAMENKYLAIRNF